MAKQGAAVKKIIILLAGAVAALCAAVVLFFTVRQAVASAQANEQWKSAQVEPIRDFGATSRLEILPVYEEAGDASRYQIGHGLAYLIKIDSATILMDIGNNPTEAEELPLSKNMEALGVAWDQIDMLVFSHFHPDHVGGPEAWKAGRVSAEVDAASLQGKPVYAPSVFEFPGASTTLLPDPTVLGDGIATIGTIAYGETYPISLYTAHGAEQVLAINVEGKGIVLIMGCGHPTIERIIARAEALFDQPVVGIVGGFHYEGYDSAKMQPHIDYIKARQPVLVAPSSHDSSPEALQAFQSAFSDAYRAVQVGQAIILP